MSIFKLFLNGTLGGHAEVRETKTGSKTISFSVAVSEKYKDKVDGTWKEKTMWVKATKWVQKDGSTKAADYLKKGTKVVISGQPSASAYTDKAGEVKASLEVRVDELEIMFDKKDDNGSGYSQPAQSSPVSNEVDPFAPDFDDLPF